MKKDTYSKARGGWSRILEISCEGCSVKVCDYQKDGPGPLKRMYIDRMINSSPASPELACSACKRILGMRVVYEKENRPAYRLFQDSVTKKIVPQNKILAT